MNRLPSEPIFPPRSSGGAADSAAGIIAHIGKPIDNFSSMPAPYAYLTQFVPVPRTYCHQIVGIVGTVSGSRNIRDRTFYYDVLFHLDAVGTENVSFPKPVSSASCHVDRSHCLSNLLFAIHPLAQFLSSVLENNSDLIFSTVLVRHLFLPSATTVLGFTGGAPQLFRTAIARA